MNDENNWPDDSLLARFLAGEATPEEAIKVNEWIEINEENKLYYRQLEKIWLGSAKLPETPDKDRFWVKLTQLKSHEKRRRQYLPYQIAAGILFLIGATLSIYFLSKSDDVKLEAWNVKQTFTEVAILNLPDGSSVTVNRNSRIQWPNDPNFNHREIRLDGEAFFDVSHNPERPFVVSIDEINIKVLGTAFNVMVSDRVIETEVIRGRVMMLNSNKSVIIDAGMKGVYDKASKEISLIKLQNENDVAYATHILTFESVPLKKVCEHLSKTYGVQFFFENSKIEDCTLTSAYSNKSLAFIMNVISESLGITYQIRENSVYISGDGCF